MDERKNEFISLSELFLLNLVQLGVIKALQETSAHSGIHSPSAQFFGHPLRRYLCSHGQEQLTASCVYHDLREGGQRREHIHALLGLNDEVACIISNWPIFGYIPHLTARESGNWSYFSRQPNCPLNFLILYKG